MNNIFTIAQTVWLEMIRRKDIYVILSLQAFFTFLLTTVDAFGTQVPSSYIMDIGLMLAFLLSIFLSIVLSTRQIPSEIRSGTIFSILTKPITRLEFLAGKLLGLWTGMTCANALFYLIITCITLSRGYSFSFPALIQTLTLHSFMLGVIISIGLLITTFASQGAGSSLTAIIAFMTLFMIPRIPSMLTHENGWRAGLLWISYFTSPHLELFDMRARLLHGWGPVEMWVFTSTVIYGILLITFFTSIAWLIFRRKHFKRGANV